MGSREDVLRVADEWCGTPYHHRGAVKGHGADCGTLLICVYAEAGVIDKFEPKAYSRQFHLHRDEEWYLEYVKSWATQVETPQPGDIAMWKIGRIYSHGAIVVAWPLVIHALAKELFVMRDDISRGALASRTPIFFDPWARPK